MTCKENAERAAEDTVTRVVRKHGVQRGAVIVGIISTIETAACNVQLSPDEFATIAKELQATVDSWVAFKSKN